MSTTNQEIIGALALFLLEHTNSIWGEFIGRISFADQRKHFGCVPFGKRTTYINGLEETVQSSWSIAFGQDREVIELGWLELEKKIRAGADPFRDYLVPATGKRSKLVI